MKVIDQGVLFAIFIHAQLFECLLLAEAFMKIMGRLVACLVSHDECLLDDVDLTALDSEFIANIPHSLDYFVIFCFNLLNFLFD